MSIGRTASPEGDGMRSSLLGRLVVSLYRRLPARRKWLSLATRAEGGEMFSLSLRRVLAEHHGVKVGRYSYGALLRVGFCDPLTDIGAYVSIGPGVRRFGAAHPLDAPSLHPFWYNPALGMVGPDEDVERTPCSIGDDVWIGANAVILPGCRSIGTGAVIGAGAVVTKDVPAFAVVGGSPARLLSERLEPDERAAILASRYWELPPREARALLDNLRAPGEPR